jgi:hypothetical protein
MESPPSYDMSNIREIKRNLEIRWIQFLNSNAPKLASKSLSGASPPAVFVGQHGYPKVRVGPMLPPVHGDTTILDSPERWAGKSIEEIANYRLSLVRGFSNVSINTTSGKYVESLQELAMASRSAESELTFEKIPAMGMQQNGFGFDTDSAPHGLAGAIKTFRPSPSLSVDKRIETAFYDKDLAATKAIVDLYYRGVDITKINRALSIGMLGTRKNRKLVPTRWSISATDDTISTSLASEIEVNQPIDRFEVYRYAHLGNHYSVILIPSPTWALEVDEAWIDNNGRFGIGRDFEDSLVGMNHHPSIAGAYFAARLSITEHLRNSRRKAASMVLREIHPQYVVPVGVWQVREGIREALRRPSIKFESFDNALSFACSSLSVSKNEWSKGSKMHGNVTRQKRMSDYL